MHDITSQILRAFRHYKVGEPTNLDEELWNLIGIFSENRPEWVTTELACIRDSIAVVSIYSDAAPSMVQAVL